MASQVLFLLLPAAVWSLGEAVPILSSLLFGASEKSGDIDNQYDGKQAISDLLEKANNAVLEPLYQMDIAAKTGRGVRKCKACHWERSTQGFILVPFVLSADYSSGNRDLILLAMQEFATMTCVQFIDRTTERDHLHIVNQPGCWGFVGKKGWIQPLNLQESTCMVYGIIQHELMHALGFYHEHTRGDRDKHLHINWQYISPADEINFLKDDEDNQGIAYDYGSVMHYGRTIHTNTTGKSTMVPIPDSTVPIGQTVGLSSLDVRRINAFYSCSQCRTKVLGASGTFSSEQATTVKNNDNCLWLLQTPKSPILLQFAQFYCSTNKCNDKVNVYNGGSKSAALLATVYADQPLPVLVSSSSFLLLEYITAAPGQSTFRGSYSSVTHSGIYTEPAGIITSPNFPFDYPNEASAIYMIIAPPGYKISLIISLVNLEWSSGCAKDSLVIRDGGDLTAPSLGVYCGPLRLPLNVNSRGPRLLLQFSSDGDTTKTGFMASYIFKSEQSSPLNLKLPLLWPLFE